MESSYGVAEMQQNLAVEERCTPVLTIPHEMNINSSSSNDKNTAPQQNPNQYHQKHLHYHHYQQQHPLPTFQHLLPITQQLFEQQHYQYQDLQQRRVQQQQGLEQEPVRVPNNFNSPGFPFVSNDFRFDLNRNSVYREESSAIVKEPFFGELEAIYTSAGYEINQTASGSALTGENTLTTAGWLEPFGGDPRLYGTTTTTAACARVDHGSETSIGEEVSLRKKLHKRRRNKKKRKQLSYITSFFEKLVKKLMDHQEDLHKKFLEVMERMDQERRDREEEWRHHVAKKYDREEAIARAQEQAQASSRESAIVSYLERIAGQGEGPMMMPLETNNTSIRWPQREVQALIGVRISLESKFQEPGLKGFLWEEISSSMAEMGYQRNAKRCKEKWENINKYFRKTKDSGKKRPKYSKSCSYFHHLNQFYSTTRESGSSSSSSSFCNLSEILQQPKDNLELLDVIIEEEEEDDEVQDSLKIKEN